MIEEIDGTAEAPSGEEASTPPSTPSSGAEPGTASTRHAPRRPGGARYTERRPRSRQYNRRRPKVCAFCVQKVKSIDYKDVGLLRRFVTRRGKILSQRKSGTCAKHQRRLAVAIKRARHLALLPFAAEQRREG